MHTKLAAQTVEFIAASSVLNDRLMGEVQTYRQNEKKAADKLDSVLNLMIETGCVAPHQKQAAADMLGSHSQSLDLLVNAITKMQGYKQASEASAANLGHAVSEKEAGFNSSPTVRSSLEDPYVGRRSSEKKASDIALMAVLNAPTRS